MIFDDKIVRIGKRADKSGLLKERIAIMNKKQKICIAGGLIAIVLGAINAVSKFYTPGFDIWLVMVVLITAGLVYHFKEKKEEK